MSILDQNGNKCYFIHIPRTGGRYLVELFKKNNVSTNHLDLNEYVRGVQIRHFHYPLYNIFLEVEDLTHFSVVRNPFDKIQSSIQSMHKMDGLDYNKILDTEEKFYDFLIRQIEFNSFHNNWFLPQYKFITKKTHIWKYEDGLDQKFFNWIYEKTNIKLEKFEINGYESLQVISHEQEISHENSYLLENRFKKYISNFYEKDYELFEYY